MDACPVTKEDIPIAELNAATVSPDPPRGRIYEFTVNCVQCARCVPVCPPRVRRDLMMLYLKWKLDQHDQYPRKYNRYVIFKRPNLSRIKRKILQLRTRGYNESHGPFFE
ncbi:MAG: hypothetical protein ACTSU5_05835 [Promethearchaeota archaeon]